MLANQAQRKTASVVSIHKPKPVLRNDQEISLQIANEKVGRKKVLLVEGDGLIRMNTAEMLEDAGLVVAEAASAEEA